MGKFGSYSQKTSPELTDEALIKDNTGAATKRVLLSALKTLFGTSLIIDTPTVRNWDGWEDSNETWTYSSYDSTNKTGVITVPSDATLKYQPGDRVKFTQTTVKYGIVTKVTSTALTIYFGTDYSLANATISSNYYSHIKSPVGFPLDPTKWTVEVTSTSQCQKSSPTAGTWYGDSALSSTGPSISVPIGAWNLSYQAALTFDKATTTSIAASISLSTSASSESDVDFTENHELDGASGTLVLITGAARQKYISVSSATTYYLIVKAVTASLNSVRIQGNLTKTAIRAVCAYL